MRVDELGGERCRQVWTVFQRLRVGKEKRSAWEASVKRCVAASEVVDKKDG